jgi:hypothetical protein
MKVISLSEYKEHTHLLHLWNTNQHRTIPRNREHTTRTLQEDTQNNHKSHKKEAKNTQHHPQKQHTRTNTPNKYEIKGQKNYTSALKISRKIKKETERDLKSPPPKNNRIKDQKRQFRDRKAKHSSQQAKHII